MLLGAGAWACGEPAGPGELTDQLIFTSAREGAMQGGTPLFDIFRMNADGSRVVNLTNRPGKYDYLGLAPDGRTIVFELTPDLNDWNRSGCATQVWRIDVEGSGLRQLTSDDCARMPRLSPDGRHVAFVRGSDVWVVGTDGTRGRSVSGALPPVVPNACGEMPKVTVQTIGWLSPSQLLFRRHICLAGTTHYVVDTDGNGLAPVDYDASITYVSPNGRQLAFERNPYQPTSEVVVSNADGSNARTIATPAALPTRLYHNGTVWSPDGSQLYYYTTTGHFVGRADRSGTRKVAEMIPAWNGSFQDWSADGTRLAFKVHGSARPEIAVVNADGSGFAALTTGMTGSIGEVLWIRR